MSADKQQAPTVLPVTVNLYTHQNVMILVYCDEDNR